MAIAAEHDESESSGPHGGAELALPPADTEIELKLTATPEALAALRESDLIASRALGPPETRSLESAYYDTPDRRLQQRGAGLRVRRAGGGFVQTLKAEDDDNAALFGRGEWEAPVASFEPDLAALSAEPARALLDDIDPDALAPVFATRIERTTRPVAVPRTHGAGNGGSEAEVECAFDTGAVEAGGRSVAVSEVELELTRGAPAALYRFAAELHALAPLRVETLSKAARGHLLAAGAVPPYRKAVALDLDGDATAGEVLDAILRGCFRHCLANQATALDGRDPEGVHQMRVALRRLRSALAAFRPLLGGDRVDWLAAETRWLAAALGPARDWDVFLAELVAPVAEALPDRTELAVLRRAAEAERARGYAQAREAIESGRATTLLLALGEWIEGAGWRDGGDTDALAHPATEVAGRLLDRRHRKAMKSGRGFARLGADQRHEVRIQLKKVRYLTEFFLSLYSGRRGRAYLNALTGLQKGLGRLNDVAVAERLLATVVADQAAAAIDAGNGTDALCFGAGIVVGWHRRGVQELEPRLRDDWDAFAEARPFWTGPGR